MEKRARISPVSSTEMTNVERTRLADQLMGRVFDLGLSGQCAEIGAVDPQCFPAEAAIDRRRHTIPGLACLCDRRLWL